MNHLKSSPSGSDTQSIVTCQLISQIPSLLNSQRPSQLELAANKKTNQPVVLYAERTSQSPKSTLSYSENQQRRDTRNLLQLSDKVARVHK